MKMTKLEKRFVNSKRHSRNNIRIADALMRKIDLAGVKHALEVGCGFGTVTAHLAERYSLGVTGTDIDPDQIELAKTVNRQNKRLRFFAADAVELPFEKDTFDLVLSFKVLHHIRNWDAALGEISRVLRPGGFYVYNDLVSPGFIKPIFNTVIRRMGVYTRADIRHCLEKLEFKSVYSLNPGGIILVHDSAIFQKNPYFRLNKQ